MPSREHAILVELFRASPGLVSTVLPRLGVALPDAVNLEVLESSRPKILVLISPDLAVLSLLVHGRGADKAALRRASLPILALESSVARLYFGLLWSSLESVTLVRWRVS